MAATASPKFKLPFILLVFYIVINVSNSTTPALPPNFYGSSPSQAPPPPASPPNLLGPIPNIAFPPNIFGSSPSLAPPPAALPPNFLGSAPSMKYPASPPNLLGPIPNIAFPPNIFGSSPSLAPPPAALPPNFLGSAPSMKYPASPPNLLGPIPNIPLPPNFLAPSPNTALPPNFLGPFPNTASPALPPIFFGSDPIIAASSPSPSPSPKPLPPRPSPLGPPSQGIKAAYWPSFDGFPASSIDTSYFTHIYYAFVLPDPVTYELDIVPFHKAKIPEFINALHARGTTVKTMLSIGGGGNNSTVFSQMVSTELTRAVFINSTIRVSREYGFDGVDLDWEFPENDLDMSNLALLFKQWRNALAYEAQVSKRPRLLLTSAVYFASKITFLSAAPTYPGKSIAKYVDWVSPMCFDYHGSWDSNTGEHSALYDPNSNISTSFGIQSWIRSGVPPEKIVMGVPLYGHTWTLRDPKVNGVGAPTVGVGPGNGTLSYSEIIDYNSENNAVVKFDKQSVSIYSYAGDSWIGYDDILSTKLKIQFARARALRGYFFWALGNDKNWTISREASCAWGH